MRRFWPRRYRRSSFYWKLISLDRRFGISDRIEARNGRPPRERVVQDIEIPIERTCDFLGGSWTTCQSRQSGCARCAFATATAGRCTRCGRITRTSTSASGRRCRGARPRGAANRMIEEKVSELDGHKSLYSDSFYSREDFDELYGGEAYNTVKKTYDPDSRLLDLYAKAVQRR